MNIEHIAFNVADPPAMAEWYGRHLGTRIIRRFATATQTHFLADESGRVVVELYRHVQAGIPDYAAMDPLVLHIAFLVSDIDKERQRLLTAGATPVGEITSNDSGDRLAMLRDPWGLAVQLVKRTTPLGE